MKFFKRMIILGIMLFYSCNASLPGLDFDLFKGTPSYELALAVKHESIDEIAEIASKKKNLLIL